MEPQDEVQTLLTEPFSHVQGTYDNMEGMNLTGFFMYKVLDDVIYTVVEEQSTGMNVDVKHKEFIAHFYSLAVVAMGLDGVRGGMKEDPEDIAEQVAILVKGDFKKALGYMRNDYIKIKINILRKYII